MVMVKAFAYGLGASKVAIQLEKEGVDCFGVANILEGIEIRKAGIKTPVMVMNPQKLSYDLMIDFDLSPVIFSVHDLDLFVNNLLIKDDVKPYPISIKIDTGMHRLGFSVDGVDDLLQKLNEYKTHVKIDSILSHLSSADNPNHDSFTLNQIKLFNHIYDKIVAQLNYHVDKHILNTSGIIRFTKYQFDMVRLGIGVYGYCSDEHTQLKLKNVSTLKTKISHIIEVPKDETIGYNRKGKTTKKSTIATIPIGYADGFNRLLSNGKWSVLINGCKAPVVGNVSMDMTSIDITDIKCKVGDEVIVFGEKNNLSLMAKQIGTIPYELLTTISPRVKRVYC